MSVYKVQLHDTAAPDNKYIAYDYRRASSIEMVATMIDDASIVAEINSTHNTLKRLDEYKVHSMVLEFKQDLGGLIDAPPFADTIAIDHTHNALVTLFDRPASTADISIYDLETQEKILIMFTYKDKQDNILFKHGISMYKNHYTSTLTPVNVNVLVIVKAIVEVIKHMEVPFVEVFAENKVVRDSLQCLNNKFNNLALIENTLKYSALDLNMLTVHNVVTYY